MSSSTGRDQIIYSLGKLDAYLTGGDSLLYFYELEANKQLIEDFHIRVKGIDSFTQHFESVLEFRFYRIMLYCLIRRLKPAYVIETGVLHGMTTAFMLEAIRSNEIGKLVSIDFPSYFETGPANNDGYNDTLPPDKEPGWIIPDRLKKSWDLILGPSQKVLPNYTEAQAEQYDLFIHDSDHSYNNMLFELESGWQNLSPRGVLVCDNIDSNSAFFDFCRQVDRHPLIFSAPNASAHQPIRFGVINK